jgi:hypothetical protein
MDIERFVSSWNVYGLVLSYCSFFLKKKILSVPRKLRNSGDETQHEPLRM